MKKKCLLLPVFNEEESLPMVLSHLPPHFYNDIVVVNNGSTDKSKEVAMKFNVHVVDEMRRGYGQACLTGIEYIRMNLKPDYLVFMDADFSDYPEDALKLVDKLDEGFDFVLGSRTMDSEGQKGLSSTNKLGNRLAGFFLKLLFRRDFTDLGPFRAIRFDKLLDLNMNDRNFGWTIEMQIKAIRHKLIMTEIPVKYRFRYAGKSKVTGTFKGSVNAFFKITYMFIVYFLRIK